MQNVMKRSVIAGAAIAAAGLLGSLPYTGSTMAQQAAPTVHHDVSLVDLSDQILGLETQINNDLFDLVLGPGGLQDQTFSTTTLLVGSDLANYLLGTTVDDNYSTILNGASTDFSQALYFDGLAYQDTLNQLLGVSVTASHQAIIDQLTANGNPDNILGVLAVGDSVANFNQDLMAAAATNFAALDPELATYFSNLVTDLPTVLGGLDLSSFLDGSALGTILGFFGL